MQRVELEQDQQQFKQQISELKADIASLAAQRAALEQENHCYSPLVQRLGKYVGFGTAGKLEWVCFKLNFKQEELARLVLHPDARMNGVATLLSMVPAHKPTATSETTQHKMERMVTENPPALESHIRRVYQSLIEAEQQGRG